MLRAFIAQDSEIESEKIQGQGPGGSLARRQQNDKIVSFTFSFLYIIPLYIYIYKPVEILYLRVQRLNSHFIPIQSIPYRYIMFVMYIHNRQINIPSMNVSMLQICICWGSRRFHIDISHCTMRTESRNLAPPTRNRSSLSERDVRSVEYAAFLASSKADYRNSSIASLFRARDTRRLSPTSRAIPLNLLFYHFLFLLSILFCFFPSFSL